jgi:hypothetical protein
MSGTGTGLVRDVFFLLAALTSGAAIYYRRRAKAIDDLPRAAISIDRIPEIRDRLRERGVEDSFTAFLFATPDRLSREDALAAQLSFEGGSVGFDWVLLARRNVEERARVEEFARWRGFHLLERQRNGVRYLRSEDGDVASLCTSVITELFGVPPSNKLEMVYRGLEWQAG